MKDILIFGAGGHAKVIADIFLQSNEYTVRAFVDDRLAGTRVLDIEVLNEMDAFASSVTSAFVAIGDNAVRAKVVRKIQKARPDMSFVVARHPAARVATDVAVGAGSALMANAVVNVCTRIGEHCILNTAASVDHDCIVQDFASIAPGATLGGNCVIGRSAAISIGATLIHGIKIGDHSVVGAGSVVVKNLVGGTVAYGVPAQVVRSRVEGDRYL